jgi:hypothetical protein
MRGSVVYVYCVDGKPAYLAPGPDLYAEPVSKVRFEAFPKPWAFEERQR